MPADLLESELFGYEQGAFTGAVKTKPGKFEICSGGTIFLDEIGEMPAILQAKLLQVLQDGTFMRLGSRSPMKVDVRVIAATNINMKEAMANKTFREDLYYRLNGFTLSIPALRQRKEEVPILAEYFMRKAAKRYGREPLLFSTTLMEALTGYRWPGNIRELENVINRYLVLGEERAILDELAIHEVVDRSPQCVWQMRQTAMAVSSRWCAASKVRPKPSRFNRYWRVWDGIGRRQQTTSRSATRLCCTRSSSTTFPRRVTRKLRLAGPRTSGPRPQHL